MRADNAHGPNSTHAHDRGGWPTKEKVDPVEKPKQDWEAEAYALIITLSKKGIFRSGQSRLPVEQLTRKQYDSMGYYDRWVYSLEERLSEKGMLTKAEVSKRTKALERKPGKGIC